MHSSKIEMLFSIFEKKKKNYVSISMFFPEIIDL